MLSLSCPQLRSVGDPDLAAEGSWTQCDETLTPREQYPPISKETVPQIIAAVRKRMVDIVGLMDDLSNLTRKGISHSPRGASTPKVVDHIFEQVPPLAAHSDRFDVSDKAVFLDTPLRSSQTSVTSVLRISNDSVENSTFKVGDENEEKEEHRDADNDDHTQPYCIEFAIKKEWTTFADSASLTLAHRSASIVMPPRMLSNSFMSDASSSPGGTKIFVEASGGYLSKMISSPASSRRVAWELLGVALVLYDLMAIPLLLAFDPPDSALVQTLDWIGRVFWTANIPVTLTTGVIHRGVLILTFPGILRHYARTWLVVDLVTVIPDWSFLILSMLSSDDNENDATTLVRLFNFFRLLRLARLMRIAKLRDAWNMIIDMIVSEKVGIILDVIKNILFLMVANHFIACLWFVIARSQTGRSWLKYYSYSKDRLDWGHQYLISYHWSITQFASSMHVQPQNVSERTFAIMVVIFGMVGFAYVVGSITSSLARLRAMDEKRATNMWHLRKFLRHEDIPHELCVRIKSYVESRWEKQQQSHGVGSDLEVLSLLSDNLKSELASVINGPIVSVHPFLRELQFHCRTTTQRWLHNGVSTLFLAPHDTMFSAGEHGNFMSILISGTMQYERMHLDSRYPEVVESHEDWVAEPVLWVCDWCHIGDLTSTTPTELLLLDPNKMHSITKSNPLAFMMLSSYCKEYVVWLNKFPTENLSDISQGDRVGMNLSEITQDVLRKLSLKPLGQRSYGPKGFSITSKLFYKPRRPSKGSESNSHSSGVASPGSVVFTSEVNSPTSESMSSAKSFAFPHLFT